MLKHLLLLNYRNVHTSFTPGKMKIRKIECAFRGCLESYCIEASQRKRKDPITFVARSFKYLKIIMERSMKTHKGFKMQICLKTKFAKMDKVSTESYSNCKQIIVLPGNNFEDLLMSPIAKIIQQIDEFQEKGSGWQFCEIVHMDVHISRYQPLRGSSHVELPAYIRNKHAVINVQNNDNKCFVWSVLSSLYQATRSAHRRMNYVQHLDDINWKCFEMPMKLQDIPKFEELNQLSISVYDYEDGNFAPLRISSFKHERHIPLLLYKGHYCWIKNLDRLLHDQNKHNGKRYCPCCLFPLRNQDELEKHFSKCRDGTHMRITMPAEDNNILSFRNIHRQLEAPLIIYADFECLTEAIAGPTPNVETSYSKNYQRHTPCGYAILPVERSRNGMKHRDITLFRGENTMEHFLNKVIQLAEEHHNSMTKPLEMHKQDWNVFFRSKNCHICEKGLGEDRVRDHCHMSGKFRGAAHSQCNISFRLNRDVTVGIHNLRRYDGHIIMNQLGSICKDRADMEIHAVAKNLEDYLSFSIKINKENGKRNHDGGSSIESFRIRFIDTCQFLPNSLESLANNLDDEQFVAMKKHFSQAQTSQLRRKQVYPYDYMSSWEKFHETKLPSQEHFYNILTKSQISTEDYQHALSIFEAFKIKNLGEYHDLYLTTDVLLLADVFEEFRTTAMKNYGLDPAHYITLPSYSMDAMLKKTGETPQLLTDPDMYAFFESGIRGGISVIGHRYALSNNQYLDTFDSAKPSTYSIYLDVNNLYGTAMKEKLPFCAFEWVQKEELNSFDVMQVSDESEIGFVLEVDLDYPEELHDCHNAYPLAPERLLVEDDWLSDYALKHKTTNAKVEKLIPNLMKKQNYTLHYRNLKLYLKHGMKLKMIHSAIKFTQKEWMRSYIDFNTDMRQNAKNAFEKDFFKLMNNAVFGKTMENVRNYRDVKLLSQSVHHDKYLKLVADPRFLEAKVFNNELVAVHMLQRTINLNKPVYSGMSILDLSKIYMYDFHYDYIIPKYGFKNVRLLMTDTDSFIYNICTEDIYKDMKEDSFRFDFSDYPQHHDLYSVVNKKVLGKMKDETSGKPIKEFVGLRAKMYSLVCHDNEELKRAKGIQKATLKNDIDHSNYLQALMNGTSFRHLMHSIRSSNHEIFSVEQNKVSLCPFDDKRYLLTDGITSLAYGHKDIPKKD